LTDYRLRRLADEFGIVNVRGICSFDGRDRYVSFDEIAQVRAGTFEFVTTMRKPFDIGATFGFALIGFFWSILVVAVLLGAIRLVQWIWGRD
jgi:hypothetical protein